MDLVTIGAHPDDCELFVGGLLAKLSRKGYATGIIDLTRGETASRGTPEDRQKESEQASQILGITKRVNLNLGDAQLEPTIKNRNAIVQVLRVLQPELVLIQYPDDRHPDHVNGARLAQEACFFAHVAHVTPGKGPFKPEEIIYYIGNVEGCPPEVNFVVDISTTFEQKIEALKAYKTQFYNPNYDAGETYISSKGYWELIHTKARFYGSMIGVKYGEGYIIKHPLAIDDPVGFFKGRL